MTILLGILSQALHGALMLGAAPLAAGLVAWLGARMRGRRAAPVWEPWRRIAALLRKRPASSEHATAVSAAAPYAAVAATMAAALLVPSFARGMALAPLADLVLVAGLLGAARCAAWLAALDAAPGAPEGAAAPAVAAEPVLLVCALVLAALTGRTNLDALWAVSDTAPVLRAPLVACGAALLVALLAERGGARGAVLREASARHLALWEYEAALRLLVWLSLLAALFVPAAAAPAGASAAGWAGGLAAWAAVVGAGCFGLALFGNLALAPRPGRAREVGLAATLLALLGAMLVFVALGTA